MVSDMIEQCVDFPTPNIKEFLVTNSGVNVFVQYAFELTLGSQPVARHVE